MAWQNKPSQWGTSTSHPWSPFQTRESKPVYPCPTSLGPWNKTAFIRKMSKCYRGQVCYLQMHRLWSIHALKGSGWTTLLPWISDNFSLTRERFAVFIPSGEEPITHRSSRITAEDSVQAYCRKWPPGRSQVHRKWLRRVPSPKEQGRLTSSSAPCASFTLRWRKGEGPLCVFHLCRGGLHFVTHTRVQCGFTMIYDPVFFLPPPQPPGQSTYLVSLNLCHDPKVSLLKKWHPFCHLAIQIGIVYGITAIRGWLLG